MEQLKNIINNVIGKMSSGSAISNQDLWQAWEGAIGKKLIKHTAIEGVRNGKLSVRVDSPVMMFQLNLKRNHIIKKLQKIDKELTDINLRIGKVQ